MKTKANIKIVISLLAVSILLALGIIGYLVYLRTLPSDTPVAGAVVCGDNDLDVGEQCDDGNLVNGDGCNQLCQAEVLACGSGAPTAIGFETASFGGPLGSPGNVFNYFTWETASPDCGINAPFVATYGAPQECYSVSNGGGVDALNGVPASQAGTNFLCSAWEIVPGSTWNDPLKACGINIIYKKPSLGFSIDVVDLDGGEGWKVTAYNYAGQVITTNTVQTVTGQSTYDGKLINLSIPTTTQPIWKVSVTTVGDKTQEQQQWGHGFDNMSLFCGNNNPQERCGDGITTTNTGEQCDDGNNVNGDGCSATCQLEEDGPVCGDGTLDTGEQCDDGNNTNGDGCNSVCQTEVTQTLDLQIVKLGTIASTNATQSVINYSLIVTNPNTTAVTNVIVTDQMEDFVVSSAVQNTSSYTFNFNNTTHVGTWGPINQIPAGGSITITYTLTVAAANYGTIPNTASVYIDTNNNGIPDSNELEDTADEVIVIEVEAPNDPLTIDKTSQIVSNTSTQAVVEYTLTVVNPNDEAVEDVIVTDVLEAFVQAGQIQNLSTQYTFSFNPTTHTATWTGIDSIPANGTITIRYRVTILAANYGAVDNTAIVWVDDNGNGTPDPGEDDDTDTEIVNLAPQCTGLALISGDATVAPGDVQGYEVSFPSSSPNPYPNIRLLVSSSNTVASGVGRGFTQPTQVLVAPSGNSFTGGIATYSFVWEATNVGGADVPDGTYEVRVLTDGTIATLVTTPAGCTAQVIVETGEQPEPVFTVTKSNGNGTAPVACNSNGGAVINYTITVRNVSAVSGTVDIVRDVLPTGVNGTTQITNVTPSGTVSATQITWTGPFTIAAGATMTFSYTLTLNANQVTAATSGVLNTVTITYDTPTTVDNTVSFTLNTLLACITTNIPDTGIFDNNIGLLIMGLLLILGGVWANRSGPTIYRILGIKLPEEDASGTLLESFLGTRSKDRFENNLMRKVSKKQKAK